MTLSINSPFSLEAILESLLEDNCPRIKIYYGDDNYNEGFISQEYHKESGKLKFILIENELDKGIPYHFIELDKVTRLDILVT